MQKKNFKISDYQFTNFSSSEEIALFNFSKLAYKKFQPIFYECMNKVVFKESYSTEYMNILLGDWIYRFIQILVEREASFENFIDGDIRLLSKKFLSTQCFYVPQSSNEFLELCADEEYNEQIYSSIMRSKYNPTKTYSNFGYLIKLSIIKNINFLNFKIKYLIKNSFLRNRFDNSVTNKILVLDPKLGAWKKIKKQNDYDFVTRLGFQKLDGVNQKIRKKIELHLKKNIDHKDMFQVLLSKIIVTYIPRDYIESFESIKSKVIKLSDGLIPEHIVTIPIWRFSCSMAIFLAEVKNKYSAKIHVLQHGGGYGIIKHDPLLECEQEIADFFYTWGWADQSAKLKPMPSPMISSQIVEQMKFDLHKRREIFFPINLVPRFRRDLSSNLSPKQVNDQFDQKGRFVKTLNQSLKNQLIFKRYHHDYGWNHLSKIKEISSNISSRRQSFAEILNSARILVSDSNQTSFLVSMSLNIPTIIYFEYDLQNTLNDRAHGIFKKLEEIKVLHRSPEKAALFINKIYDDPKKWWDDPEVKHVVKEFNNKFAYADKDFINLWSKEFKNLIS